MVSANDERVIYTCLSCPTEAAYDHDGKLLTIMRGNHEK
jgi:hypothetical protein